MATTKLLIFVSSCLLCVRTVCCQQEKKNDWDGDKYKEEAAQTFNLVFHKYNPRVRPPQEEIEVTTNISLMHIRHLDLRKQELQTVLDVEMSWSDSRLQWYPIRVTQISANTSTVWTPDIVFTNSVAESKLLYPSAVKISNKGLVVWTRKEVVTTICATQLNNTVQNCQITLGFMSNSRKDQTDRYFSKNSIFMADNFINHEWNLVEKELNFFNESEKQAYTIKLSLVLHYKTDVTDKIKSQQKDSDHEPSNNSKDTDQLNQTNSNGSSFVLLQLPLVPLLWLEAVVVPQLCPWLLLR